MVTVGIDEVGRGCWAGPLVAGAVILHSRIPGLTDSKLLTKAARPHFDDLIRQSGAVTGLGWVTSEEIDEFGLTAGVRLAMERALQAITVPFDEVIIDGNYNFLSHLEHTTAQIKADLTVPSVSAASIIAKVARDGYMAEQAKLFPAYNFDKHVGYGTTAHRQALVQYGLTHLHRRSYKPIKALLK